MTINTSIQNIRTDTVALSKALKDSKPEIAKKGKECIQQLTSKERDCYVEMLYPTKANPHFKQKVVDSLEAKLHKITDDSDTISNPKKMNVLAKMARVIKNVAGTRWTFSDVSKKVNQFADDTLRSADFDAKKILFDKDSKTAAEHFTNEYLAKFKEESKDEPQFNSAKVFLIPETYKELGVKPGVTDEKLKEAFLKCSKKDTAKAIKNYEQIYPLESALKSLFPAGSPHTLQTAFENWDAMSPEEQDLNRVHMATLSLLYAAIVNDQDLFQKL